MLLSSYYCFNTRGIKKKKKKLSNTNYWLNRGGPVFDYLNANNKMVFIDAFICKKLGSFIYEALTLRNESIDARIVN